MKLNRYLRDKLYEIIIAILVLILMTLLLVAFKVSRDLMLVLLSIFIIYVVATLLIDFFRKRSFYNALSSNVDALDQAYLVLETIYKPNFYEGILLTDSLYKINKSMCENVGSLREQIESFKNYIEMWIHEVKIPISALVLMSHNHKNLSGKKVLDQVARIEHFTEQVLYYTRGENAEKDYLISEVSLGKIVNSVALKNKDIFLSSKINFKVSDVNVKVLTDSKWLEFIVNQIVNNSVKYRDDEKVSEISIHAIQSGESTTLYIRDNGIGISASDISKVFEKSFTGSNGRAVENSTGMGLFIASSLAKKLGHKIEIDSQFGEWTEVKITFNKPDFYDVVK